MIASAVAGDPKVAKCVFEAGLRLKEEKKVAKALLTPWRPEDFGLRVSVTQIPQDGWGEDRLKAWWRFMMGGWIEGWVALCVEELTNIKPSQGSYWKLRDRQFEVDVALVRGNRLYLISCTTDHTPSLCKSKLFEVAMRARQLGGDLARSALVCLIDGADSKGKYIDQLRGDVESVWDAPNKPRAFGLADLREWVGTGRASNLQTLKAWLDS